MSEQHHDEALMRIEQLLIALLRAATAQKLTEIRADKTLVLIYSLTGRESIAEIARRARVSTGNVSGIWQSWEDAGLIVKDGRSFRKLV